MADTGLEFWELSPGDLGVLGVGGWHRAGAWRSFPLFSCPPPSSCPPSLNYILWIFVAEVLSDNYLLFRKHVAFLPSLEQKHCRWASSKTAEIHHEPIRKLGKHIWCGMISWITFFGECRRTCFSAVCTHEDNWDRRLVPLPFCTLVVWGRDHGRRSSKTWFLVQREETGNDRNEHSKFFFRILRD